MAMIIHYDRPHHSDLSHMIKHRAGSLNGWRKLRTGGAGGGRAAALRIRTQPYCSVLNELTPPVTSGGARGSFTKVMVG